jgi:hypothetical protein
MSEPIEKDKAIMTNQCQNSKPKYGTIAPTSLPFSFDFEVPFDIWVLDFDIVISCLHEKI